MEPGCPNATSPARINTSKAFKCDGKCQFSYSGDNFTVEALRNSGTFLSFDLSGPSGGGATFNGISYTPQELFIYSPSLHEYNGQKAEAETVIVLRSVSARMLFVCTPLSVSGTSGPVDSLINIASERTPSAAAGERAISEKVDLNTLFGDTQFFTYSGTGLGERTTCDTGVRFVVYAPPNTKAILPGTLRKLQNIIKEDCKLPPVDNPSVVVNIDGPGGGVGGGDIYIKCEPTGSSLETKEVAFYDLNIFDPSNMGNAWTMIIGLFAAIVMWGLWTAFGRLLNSLLGPQSMDPPVPAVKSG